MSCKKLVKAVEATSQCYEIQQVVKGLFKLDGMPRYSYSYSEIDGLHESHTDFVTMLN